MIQPMRYARRLDAVTAVRRAIKLIRSSGRVIQVWRLMLLGLSQPRVLTD